MSWKWVCNRKPLCVCFLAMGGSLHWLLEEWKRGPLGVHHQGGGSHPHCNSKAPGDSLPYHRCVGFPPLSPQTHSPPLFSWSVPKGADFCWLGLSAPLAAGLWLHSAPERHQLEMERQEGKEVRWVFPASVRCLLSRLSPLGVTTVSLGSRALALTAPVTLPPSFPRLSTVDGFSLLLALGASPSLFGALLQHFPL